MIMPNVAILTPWSNCSRETTIRNADVPNTKPDAHRLSLRMAMPPTSNNMLGSKNAIRM
jgi:hypothetical protein